MKDIKTKEHGSKPKTRNPASRMPKELVRTTALEMKEKSRRISDGKDSSVSGLSPSEYASGKLESAETWTASKAGKAARAAGHQAVKKSYEKIRQRKRDGHTQEAEETAEAVSGAVRDSAKTSGDSASMGRSAAAQTGSRQKETMKTSAEQAAKQGKIKVKPQDNRLPSVEQKYVVKKAPRTIKSPVMGKPTSGLKAGYHQSKQAVRGMQAAKKSAAASIQMTKTTASGTKTAAKGAAAGIKAAASAVRSVFMALGAAGGGIVLFLILIAGIIGGAAFSGGTSSAEPLSAEVLAYTSTIQKYASQYGIPEYVPVIQAIMMQESGGGGTDPMQSSECPYNTRYPNSPNAIQEPEYSIEVGIQYYASCVEEAGCGSPYDMDKLKLSLQGYNFGNGYITWAIRNHGGYSEANALQFSQEQAASHGWTRYGDPEYVPHVLRYYSGGNLFAGFLGNDQIVSTAKAQLGNEGGQKFWSWYGFQGRVEWCACFVSWCAEQSGLISSGSVLKFSYCPTGVEWFKSQGKWQDRGYTPTPGTIIFFDWATNGGPDGTSDHVGIVEKCENGVVYTIEGNSGDAVRQRSYDVNLGSIMGYGLLSN